MSENGSTNITYTVKEILASMDAKIDSKFAAQDAVLLELRRDVSQLKDDKATREGRTSVFSKGLPIVISAAAMVASLPAAAFILFGRA